MSAAEEAPSTDIMNVREIIECAFGDFDDNTVNFKLLQTVLLLIARQLRVLERRVEVEMGPYLPSPSANTLSITEVKIHANQKIGKTPKRAGAAGAKPGGAGGGGGVSVGEGASGGGGVSVGGGASGGTKAKTPGQQSSGSEKTFTDKTSTSTSTDRTSTDKTTSSDSTTKEKTSRTSAQEARGQKPYSNPDILSALEEQRERVLRIIHQRADSFEEATKSPTPMASVSSIPKQYETLLVVKKVPSKESRSGDTGQQRSPHISVVTQEQFQELANAVRQLEKKFLPIGTPAFPDHVELMEELRKGASLTDAMAALQLSARLEATEKVLGQMITMVTDLASQTPGVGLDESKKPTFVSTAEIGQSQREFDAPRTPGFDGGAAKSSKSPKEGFPSFPATSTKKTTSGVDTVAPTEKTTSLSDTDAPTEKTQTATGFTLDEDEPSDEEVKDSVYVSFSDLKKAARQLYKDLLKKLKSDTTHTTSTATNAYQMAVKLESKLDHALMFTSRMNDLENAVKQYADQVITLDTGLTSQMTNYQEQLTQMQHDLEMGMENISELLATASGDVEAVAELHSNFTNLQRDLEVMAFRQKELRDTQDSTAYDLENLWKEIEMLRDTKSDREEVADALRDKAGIGQLNGLVALQQFEAVRSDFEKQIGAAYDKFNNQEHVWQKFIDDLVKVLNEKGDLIQVESLKDNINQHLNRIKDRMQIIADIVGEPKSAMVGKKVFRDTACLSCSSPAHMDLEEPNKVPALPKFPSGREPAEGAEGESQTKGGGDSRLCYPDMPIRHPRDPRSHICKRYCGGSHTILTDGLKRTLPGLVVQPINRTFSTAPGTDGKIYMVDEQTKKVPCLACNMPTPSLVIPEPEPPKRDSIVIFDELGGISVTPPAQNLSC